ncbi:MAG: deoxyribose-phosphate aldolase, partial [Oscillospiraceae bacterium]|nr:deoxyribose-phosphate aldolase [Oscillospiraceae bacterium]
MELRQILKTVDHTLLSQTATWAQIQNLCDEAVLYETASVCIPASYVRKAAEYLGGKVPVCTVIGFPNGYDASEVKCFAAEQAVRDGVDEIDMVVNLGWVRDGKFDEVLQEIRAVKKMCGKKILKVIIETCLLTEAEKIELCRV